MTDDALKTLLTDAVSEVDPHHRLHVIRSRTKARTWPRQWRAAGAVLAASAAAVTIAVAVGTAHDDAASGPAPGSSGASGPRPATIAVGVYYVGDTPTGPRLFREWHRADPDLAAVHAFLIMREQSAVDPDYRTLWPSMRAGGTVGMGGEGSDRYHFVEMANRRWTARPEGMTAEEAHLAVQQLVHTLQGAGGDDHPVRVVVDGEAVSLFGVDTRDGVTRDPQLEVLAPVNISDPGEGLEVEGRFTARGVAASFEANVPWEVRDGGGRVLLEGFATAEGCCDRLYPWEAEVDISSLGPGTYTFAARTDDPSGGAEGPGATEDTRTIVVR